MIYSHFSIPSRWGDGIQGHCLRQNPTLKAPFLPLKNQIPHLVSAVGVSQLQNNDNPSRWAALWVHSPKISLHTLQWAGSTRMNSFHQDRCAEPCLIGLCHYKACTVVNTILINFALRDKRRVWVSDISTSLHLTHVTVYCWKREGALPPLFQHYIWMASCTNKWCPRSPVMSWMQGSYFPLQEEN